MIDKIKELLVCKYNNCNKYFEDPIILNCGISVCKAHVDDILNENNIKNGRFNCKMCNNSHEVPLDGFIINRNLNKFFDDDSHLPDKQKQVKNLYAEFETTINNLKKLIENPSNYLHDYTSELKRQVDLHREELKAKIDDIALDIISKIDNLMEECKKDLDKFERIDIAQFENDLLTYKDYHRMAYIDEKKLQNIVDELNDLTNESKRSLDNLEKKLLKKRKCKFEKRSTSFFNSDFGIFTYEEEITLDNILTLNGHQDDVYSIISFESDKIISCSKDKTIKIWNVDTGQCLKTLIAHSLAVNTIFLLANNKLASGSSDKTVKIWNLDTYICDITLEDYNSPVFSLVEFKDYLFGGLENGDIVIWDLQTYVYINTLKKHTYRTFWLLILPNGNLVSASLDHTIKIWNINNIDDPVLLRTINDHTDQVYCLKSTNNNNNLISVSRDQSIKIWDINNEFKCIFSCHNDSENFKMSILNDKYIIVGDFSDKFKLWNIENPNECKQTYSDENFQDFLVMPNGNLVITSGSKIKIFKNKFLFE
jgi:WD40 repeat protein